LLQGKKREPVEKAGEEQGERSGTPKDTKDAEADYDQSRWAVMEFYEKLAGADGAFAVIERRLRL